tara:strand:- start:54 stop:371 length:318 start_codon:yes stop_codon:yes gene_type:complete
MSKSVVNELSRMFGANEYIDSLNNIEGWPKEAFRSTDVKGCLERDLVNPYSLTDGQKVNYMNMHDMFKIKGVLEIELLEYLEDYIKKKMVELGVSEDEMEQLLTN